MFHHQAFDASVLNERQTKIAEIRGFIAHPDSVSVFDANGGKIGTFAATQAYGIAFDNEGSLLIASRPFVVKYAVTL